MVVDSRKNSDGHQHAGEVEVAPPEHDGIVGLVAHVNLADEHEDRRADARSIDETELLFCRLDLRQEISSHKVDYVAAVQGEGYRPLHAKAFENLRHEGDKHEADREQVAEAGLPLLGVDERQSGNAEVHAPDHREEPVDGLWARGHNVVPQRDGVCDGVPGKRPACQQDGHRDETPCKEGDGGLDEAFLEEDTRIIALPIIHQRRAGQHHEDRHRPVTDDLHCHAGEPVSVPAKGPHVAVHVQGNHRDAGEDIEDVKGGYPVGGCRGCHFLSPDVKGRKAYDAYLTTA